MRRDCQTVLTNCGQPLSGPAPWYVLPNIIESVRHMRFGDDELAFVRCSVALLEDDPLPIAYEDTELASAIVLPD